MKSRLNPIRKFCRDFIHKALLSGFCQTGNKKGNGGFFYNLVGLRQGKTILFTNPIINILEKMRFHGFLPPILQGLYRLFFDYPKKVDIFINTQCNMDCQYCIMKPLRAKMVPPIPRETVLSLIDQAQALGVHIIQLLGGEPFLDPHIFEYIDYILDKGLIAGIYTNGQLIKERERDFLIARKDRLYLYFNYDHPTVFRDLTGSTEHEQIKSTMLSLKKAGISVNTFITVTEKNYPFLEELLSFCLDNDIFPMMEKCMPVEATWGKSKVLLSPDKWDLAKKMRLKLMAKKNRMPMNRLYSWFTGAECPAFQEIFHILPDGRTSPCLFMPGNYSLGNIYKVPLGQIWENYKLKRKIWNRLPQECKNCQERYLCTGGCHCIRFLCHGDYEKRDPYCLKCL